MEKIKFIIRIEPELHLKLKELAHLGRKSLNQTCIDLLSVVLANDPYCIDQPKITQSEEETLLIEKILLFFENNVLKAICRTEGYVADYVLFFVQEIKIPNDFHKNFQQIIQIMVMPQTEQAPNNMWIQIANNYKIIWSSTPEIEKDLPEKLSSWS